MKRIFTTILFAILFMTGMAFATTPTYDNYPPTADKVLQPDGSIVAIINGTTWAPADAGRATQYKTFPLSAAKYLMPDGSIINGVPITTTITGTATDGYCIKVNSSGGLVYGSCVSSITDPLTIAHGGTGQATAQAAIHALVNPSGTVVFIGDTANAKSTAGLTINQGANDDEILSLKSSDVVSPFTGISEADTYGTLSKSSSDYGGVLLSGFTEASVAAVGIYGSIGATDPSDDTPAVKIQGAKSDGSTGRAALGATETVLYVYNTTTPLFAILGNGNLQIGGIVTPGTSLAGGAVWKSGTAPSTSPADAAQVWVQDTGALAGNASLHMRNEFGDTGPVAFAGIRVASHSATENVTIPQAYTPVNLVTGAYTVSLPTAAVNYSTDFMATTAAAFSVDVATATDIIYLNGTALTAGYKATSDGSIRARLHCECNVVGIYECWNIQGLFIDGGA